MNLQDFVPSISFPWSCVCLVAVCLIVRPIKFAWSRRRLPPGPRGLPLLGNIFQIPPLQWLRFTEWKEQFGPIFSLNLAGQPVVVLNTHKVTADLLDRRSNIYSDRPRFIMAGEILTGGVSIPFMGYGELWRKLRRAAHEGLNARASENYQPLQEKEAARLTQALILDPDSWDDHLKRSAASTVLSAVYGWPPIESKDDPLVTRINDIVHRIFHAAIPGSYMVEVFPIWKHLPSWMVKWKRDGLEWHRKDTIMFEGFMDGVRKDMSVGSQQLTFATSLIENSKRHNLTDKESAWLAGTMFGAGADSTAAALAVFILAMRCYPDVMRKAQAEIDEVVGRDRMPTFADRPHLPYVRAVVKEVLRWRPVGPLSIPRRTVQGDWYNGYYIPKGTIVVPNMWAMNRDPAVFPDFEEFRPERFLDQSGQVEITPPDTHSQAHVSFGFGRRLCLGMHFANQSLFIDIASILWALSIEKAFDDNGNEIVPSRTEVVDNGLTVRPVPFKFTVTTRSVRTLEMLQAKQLSD